MKHLLVPLLLLGVTIVAAGCVSDESADHAAISTSEGCIVIELFRDEAPKTVENFLQYAEDDFYQGTIFHRIIEDFMIQGGGFTEDGQQKQTRDPIPLEYNVPNERGTIAMARTQDPNSATSQFFINTKDNTQSLGPGPNGPGYTVFGRVVEGMDVVDAIAATEVQAQPGGREVSQPVDPPVIHDVAAGRECQGAGSGGDEPAPDPVYGVEAGFIQNEKDDDGKWTTTISAATDYAPFYVINKGNQDDVFETQVVAPAAWDVSVVPGTFELKKNTEGKGQSYPYAAIGRLKIVHNEGLDDAKDANVTLTIRSTSSNEARAVLELRLVIDDKNFSRVTKPGDGVTIQYAGSFDDGEVFDDGSFSTEVASQQTVPGFSHGMMGLHIGETVDIRFPPELGYGYNTAGQYAKFDGEWLNFEITIKQLN